MTNAFDEFEQVMNSNGAVPEDVIRALLAVIHLEGCNRCGEHFRSEEFLNRFKTMLKELQLCRALSRKTAA